MWNFPVVGAWWICMISLTYSDMWQYFRFGACSICANEATDSDIWRFPMFNRMADKSTFGVGSDDDQKHRNLENIDEKHENYDQKA